MTTTMTTPMQSLVDGGKDGGGLETDLTLDNICIEWLVLESLTTNLVPPYTFKN